MSNIMYFGETLDRRSHEYGNRLQRSGSNAFGFVDYKKPSPDQDDYEKKQRMFERYESMALSCLHRANELHVLDEPTDRNGFRDLLLLRAVELLIPVKHVLVERVGVECE